MGCSGILSVRDDAQEGKLKKTLATQIREKRNELLAKCDFAVLQDAPTDKEVWSAYRQALRDVPEQPGFPYTIEWPKWPGNAEGKEK